LDLLYGQVLGRFTQPNRNLVSRPTWLEFTKASFDLVKGIAWPLALAIVVYWFRGELRSNIPRLREAGPGGVKLDPADQQQADQSSPITEAGELKPIPGFGRTPTIERVERELHKDLERYPESERLGVTVRVLAEARIATSFERIYRLIFGSQIFALRTLNAHPNGIEIDSARAFYEQKVKAAHPDELKDFTFDAWIGFLIHQNLVAVKNNIHLITNNGRDFLQYIVIQGLPEDKAF
jgi:hypothetical protein